MELMMAESTQVCCLIHANSLSLLLEHLHRANSSVKINNVNMSVVRKAYQVKVRSFKGKQLF